MKHVMIAIAAALLAAWVIGCNESNAGPAEAKASKVTLSLSGMHCQGCADLIQDKLVHTKGVSRALVSFDTKQAAIEYEAAKVTPEAMIAVVKEAGYTAALPSAQAVTPTAVPATK